MTVPCVCLDVGSGWVKALGLGADGGPVGAAARRTTPEDLLAGVRAAAAAVGLTQRAPRGRAAREAELLVCSSAGGGLRLVGVGRERLATTEAAYRVACSAGARVVHVQAGKLEPAGVRAMRAARPDVVLLLGDSGRGGEPERVLLATASRLARARVRAPIVLAAPAAVRGDAAALLRAAGRTVVTTDAVLPEPGEIVAEPARAAVTALLPDHLVGGRGSATTARFRRLARQSTPVAVRAGLGELVRARGPGAGAVLVIDVGSSTTDVYSALPPTEDGGDPAGLHATVEADLGLRTTAPGILTEGQAQSLVDPLEADLLLPTVRRLAEETDFLPEDFGARAEDRRLAALAAVLAARRHLRTAGDAPCGTGLGLVVLTGGGVPAAGLRRAGRDPGHPARGRRTERAADRVPDRGGRRVRPGAGRVAGGRRSRRGRPHRAGCAGSTRRRVGCPGCAATSCRAATGSTSLSPTWTWPTSGAGRSGWPSTRCPG